jgi:hypothetical protein
MVVSGNGEHCKCFCHKIASFSGQQRRTRRLVPLSVGCQPPPLVTFRQCQQRRALCLIPYNHDCHTLQDLVDPTKQNKHCSTRFGTAVSLLVTILWPICQDRCDARHRTGFDKLAFVQPRCSNAHTLLNLRSQEHTNNNHPQWARRFVVISLALDRLAAPNIFRATDPWHGSIVHKRSCRKWPAETVVSPFSV